MELNYPILAILLVIVIVLIILFLRKNKKDKRSMEKDLDANDTQPNKHDRNTI